MTQHTITLTDDEQRVVDWLTKRYNAANRANITTTEFLQAQVPVILRPHMRDFEASREAAIITAFQVAAETVKQQVETTLDVVKV